MRRLAIASWLVVGATATALAAPPQSPGRAALGRVDTSFPRTRHWFEQAVGIQVEVHEGALVPDWETVQHPRVLRRDSAGQRLAPRLPLSAAGTTEIAVEGEPGMWVRTTPLDVRDVAAEVHDGLVVYPGAAGHGTRDLVYKLTPTHLDEYVLIPEPVAADVRRFRVVFGPAVGGTRTTATSIEVLDRSGLARLRLERPFARDSEGRRRDGTLALEGEVLVLSVALEGLTFPVLVDPDWSTTGRMFKERFVIGVHRLPDGSVLAPGGCHLSACSRGLDPPSCSVVLELAERFVPSLNSWRQTGPMSETRFAYASAALPSGEVLVAGGCSQAGCIATSGTAEVYDLATEAFTPVGPLSSPRAFAATAPLPGGDVLVVGGCDPTGCYASAEVFELASRRFRAAASLGTPRGRATAVSLSDGRVLVAGGCGTLSCSSALDSTEIYDPVSDRWTAGPPLSLRRAGHTATRTLEGDVVILGGCPDTTCASTWQNGERFSPADGAMHAMPDMHLARYGHTATLLADGTVLVVGGCAGPGCTDTSEVFDPLRESWSDAATIPAQHGFTGQRAHHAAALLDDGRMVVVGGCNGSTCIPTSAVFPAVTPRPDGGAGTGGIGGGGAGQGGGGTGGSGGLGGGGVAGRGGAGAGAGSGDGPSIPGAGGLPGAANGALPPPLTGCACRAAERTGGAAGQGALAVLGVAWFLGRRRRGVRR